MNEYMIFKTNTEDYDRFVLCLSFESILTYIKEIENVLAQDKSEKKILIDQLLITGNGANRFMSCNFTEGRLDFKTARIVSPAECFKKETVSWLHENYLYVENSILTEEQRRKIKENVIF